MKPLLITLLLACTCSASIIVDQSQIYTSGFTEFHWVLTQDYGYLPIDTAGRIVSGLTDGFTPWLVDDGSQGYKPPCCQPGPPSPPPTPRVTVTPEPGTLLMIGAGLFSLVSLYCRDLVSGERVGAHHRPVDVVSYMFEEGCEVPVLKSLEDFTNTVRCNGHLNVSLRSDQKLITTFMPIANAFGIAVLPFG
jgi:PEP-CTERM motif